MIRPCVFRTWKKWSIRETDKQFRCSKAIALYRYIFAKIYQRGRVLCNVYSSGVRWQFLEYSKYKINRAVAARTIHARTMFFFLPPPPRFFFFFFIFDSSCTRIRTRTQAYVLRAYSNQFLLYVEN